MAGNLQRLGLIAAAIERALLLFASQQALGHSSLGVDVNRVVTGLIEITECQPELPLVNPLDHDQIITIMAQGPPLPRRILAAQLVQRGKPLALRRHLLHHTPFPAQPEDLLLLAKKAASQAVEQLLPLVVILMGYLSGGNPLQRLLNRFGIIFITDIGHGQQAHPGIDLAAEVHIYQLQPGFVTHRLALGLITAHAIGGQGSDKAVGTVLEPIILR